MFERTGEYPTAVASYDDEGVAAAIEWSCQYLCDGDTLAVWTSLKSNLQNCAELERLVARHANVHHVVGRGGRGLRRPGPVLMAWPDMDDIGELMSHGGHLVRSLCVITWNEDRLRPWVTAVQPDLLGDGSAWEEPSAAPHPVVVEGLKDLTSMINHNNTIAAGFEKDEVVSMLLLLRDARIPMDADAMQGWVLAHGGSGKNPSSLAAYVRDINAGKRPRARSVLRADYINDLKQRAARADSEK